jgi:hypothetical protein
VSVQFAREGGFVSGQYCPAEYPAIMDAVTETA